MRGGLVLRFLLLCSVAVGIGGCKGAPGYPKAEADVARPEEVVDFATLYKQNCAGCHGANGKGGPALSLANPVYLAVAGADNLRAATANGVKGTQMPPFAKSAGGMLTDPQVEALVQGMVREWGRPAAYAGVTLPDYATRGAGPGAGTGFGDVARGLMAYSTFCARCHGADGGGATVGSAKTGSVVDPSYLALVSDQSLRSTIIAGWPDEAMPDWRSDIPGSGARAMTEQEIADTVAWLASHRMKAAGQTYSANK